MNHYPHHIGDFAKDTLGFSQGAVGAYRLLMDAYYANEQAIDAEEVYVIGRATGPAERKAVDKALTKFELKDGRYYHKRVEEELAAYRNRAEIARENGKSGGRKPKDKPTDNPTDNPRRTEQQPTVEPESNRSGKLASSHKPEKPSTQQAASQASSIPEPQPPAALAAPAELSKSPDESAADLHGLCIAKHLGDVKLLHCQEWVRDGVTEEELRAAIDRGFERTTNGRPTLNFLQLMVRDVRKGIGPRNEDPDAVIRRAAAKIAAKEAGNATH